MILLHINSKTCYLFNCTNSSSIIVFSLIGMMSTGTHTGQQSVLLLGSLEGLADRLEMSLFRFHWEEGLLRRDISCL